MKSNRLQTKNTPNNKKQSKRRAPACTSQSTAYATPSPPPSHQSAAGCRDQGLGDLALPQSMRDHTCGAPGLFPAPNLTGLTAHPACQLENGRSTRMILIDRHYLVEKVRDSTKRALGLRRGRGEAGCVYLDRVVLPAGNQVHLNAGGGSLRRKDYEKRWRGMWGKGRPLHRRGGVEMDASVCSNNEDSPV